MKNIKYKLTDNYDITKIDSDILLIPFNGGEICQKAILLNEVSAIIFENIGKEKKLSEIFDLMLEIYDVKSDKLEKDFKRCIAKLLSLKVIELAE